MATQTLSHPDHGFNQTTRPANTFQSLMAEHRRIGRMTALELRAELLNERLAAGLPTDDIIFVNVDGMRDPGPDFTAKAWR
jgi:hypothetical protein